MRRLRRPKPVPPDLFTPPPARPTWAALPPETRDRVFALLTRLFGAARERRPAAAAGKEVGRE